MRCIERKVLDSFERAKLGLQVFNMPFAEAEEVIDAYVSQGDYDPDDYSGFSLTNVTVPEKYKNVTIAPVFLGKQVAQ